MVLEIIIHQDTKCIGEVKRNHFVWIPATGGVTFAGPIIGSNNCKRHTSIKNAIRLETHIASLTRIDKDWR